MTPKLPIDILYSDEVTISRSSKRRIEDLWNEELAYDAQRKRALAFGDSDDIMEFAACVMFARPDIGHTCSLILALLVIRRSKPGQTGFGGFISAMDAVNLALSDEATDIVTLFRIAESLRVHHADPKVRASLLTCVDRIRLQLTA